MRLAAVQADPVNEVFPLSYKHRALRLEPSGSQFRTQLIMEGGFRLEVDASNGSSAVVVQIGVGREPQGAVNGGIDPKRV